MKRLKNSIIFFFTAYLIVQGTGKLFANQGEYFPVFSWSLFTDVRNERDAVIIEITRIGEQTFDPPRNYYELPSLSRYAAVRSPSPKKAAWPLVKIRSDPAEFQIRLERFNAAFFDVSEEVEYQIVGVNYNPILRWRTGEVNRRWIVVGNLIKEGQ